MAFWATRALPSAVLGPVLRCAFCRFASIRRTPLNVVVLLSWWPTPKRPRSRVSLRHARFHSGWQPRFPNDRTDCWVLEGAREAWALNIGQIRQAVTE